MTRPRDGAAAASAGRESRSAFRLFGLGFLLGPLLVSGATTISGCARPPERTADRPSSQPATSGDSDGPSSRNAGDDWRIVPGVRIGPLEHDGGRENLERVYGVSEVRATRVELGEGESAPGTLLFPDHPERRLQIVWSDSSAMRLPARAILRGERSRWMLPGDVSLGTSLKELEELNGRPFELTGFAWDYAGVVTSWGGGALESTLAPSIKLYLEPRIEDRTGPEYGRVLGDREYTSANPSMRSLNPRVYQIFVDFR